MPSAGPAGKRPPAKPSTTVAQEMHRINKKLEKKKLEELIGEKGVSEIH